MVPSKHLIMLNSARKNNIQCIAIKASMPVATSRGQPHHEICKYYQGTGKAHAQVVQNLMVHQHCHVYHLNSMVRMRGREMSGPAVICRSMMSFSRMEALRGPGESSLLNPGQPAFGAQKAATFSSCTSKMQLNNRTF